MRKILAAVLIVVPMMNDDDVFSSGDSSVDPDENALEQLQAEWALGSAVQYPIKC